jgi:two-component system, LytTR family, response regulator
VIRALIVDDEELAREGMRVWLEKETDIEVVGEAADGPSAVSAIQELEPNLLFLDIQMPGFDAFEVLDRTSGPVPAVVFVTAYDRYAVQAFEARAIDYLLKPVSGDRFQEALQRVRLGLAKDEELDRTRQRVLELLKSTRRPAGGEDAAPEKKGGFIERVVVKDRDSFLLLKTEELDWIESAGNYVELHARGRSFLLRTTMSELEVQLDPSRFARIHRSTIVNVDRVQEIKPSWHGDFNVILAAGVTLRMSRGYRNRLLPD